jgi:inosine-uridine nucleoside N-ribohydrolase
MTCCVRGALAGVLLFVLPFTAVHAAPVKILFDTDMMTDCDDAGAMAVLHALADNGECEILATVVSSGDPWSAATVDAINTYYGRPDLPLGMVKSGGVLEKSKFTRRIGEDFENDFKPPAAVPDATAIYREVLEKQPDESVVVVTVGYLTNLRNLLRQPAASGHVSGAELIKSKVRTWVCMGGNFVGQPPKDDLKLGNVNFQRDAASAFEVVRDWPRPVVFVGREIGSVPSGLAIGASLAQTPPENPVRMAYQYYFGAPKSRHVADLTTVLFAVRGLRDYWDMETKGRMDLHPDMTFEWKPGQALGQAYLLKRKIDGQPNDRAIERVLDVLLIQPPRKNPQ